jgi:hypothetical protein
MSNFILAWSAGLCVGAQSKPMFFYEFCFTGTKHIPGLGVRDLEEAAAWVGGVVSSAASQANKASQQVSATRA